jgi:hypothetical protein
VDDIQQVELIAKATSRPQGVVAAMLRREKEMRAKP